MRKSGFAVLAVIVLAMAAATTKARISQTTAAAPGVPIAQPADWVPFSVEVLRHRNDSDVTGHFYRRRDGSSAMILGSGDKQAITIHNVEHRTTYSKLGNGGWTAQPISQIALQPPKRHLPLPAGSFRVLPDKVAGREVYEFVNSKTGNVAHIAPGLNGLLLKLQQHDGTGMEYVNIEVGDPPDDVFTPPPGVPVRRVDREFGSR
jgi:hypothetical protein